MVSAFLGLGANLGDRGATLSGARAALQAIPGLVVAGASPLYETAPVGGPAGQGLYLNAVLRVDTRLSPCELLRLCLAVEQRFGRERGEAWGPRTLDVDILLYGEEIRREEDPIIPHPRLHLRAFVLAPLCDLAPDRLHPLLGQTIRQLYARLSGQPGVRRLTETW